jgi:tRNA dimethylallyltransferase
MEHPLMDAHNKLVAIVGPTASGKTALSLNLAKQFDGEIICADSRTIYRDMNIGTAKPTKAEQSLVPHHLLDLILPDMSFSAQEFQQAAKIEISAMYGRHRVPFLVGGSGLYAYSVVYDYSFPAGAQSPLRAYLESLPLAQLVAKLTAEDLDKASEIDLHNPRRVIRALETAGQPRPHKSQLPSSVLLLGLKTNNEQLNQKIAQRTRSMIQIGLVAEVEKLVNLYGTSCDALRSPGYSEIIDYLSGKFTLDEAEKLINLHTLQLVKKQHTWYRRNKDIRWLERPEDASGIVSTFLGSR